MLTEGLGSQAQKAWPPQHELCWRLRADTPLSLPSQSNGIYHAVNHGSKSPSTPPSPPHQMLRARTTPQAQGAQSHCVTLWFGKEAKERGASRDFYIKFFMQSMFCSRGDLGQPSKVCKADLGGVLQLREKKEKQAEPLTAPGVGSLGSLGLLSREAQGSRAPQACPSSEGTFERLECVWVYTGEQVLCMRLCMCECLCVHFCVCLWRPEIDFALVFLHLMF